MRKQSIAVAEGGLWAGLFFLTSEIWMWFSITLYGVVMVSTRKLRWTVFSPLLPPNWIGLFLAIVSFILFILAFAQRRRHVLTTDGLYGWSRHPQYVSLAICSFGLLYSHTSVANLAVWCLLVLLYVVKARGEETALERQFGEEYTDYKKRIPRYIYPNPFRALIWSWGKSKFATTVLFLLFASILWVFLIDGPEVPKLVRGEPTYIRFWRPRERRETQEGVLLWNPYGPDMQWAAYKAALEHSLVDAFKKEWEAVYREKLRAELIGFSNETMVFGFEPDVPEYTDRAYVIEVSVDTKEKRVTGIKVYGERIEVQ